MFKFLGLTFFSKKVRGGFACAIFDFVGGRSYYIMTGVVSLVFSSSLTFLNIYADKAAIYFMIELSTIFEQIPDTPWNTVEDEAVILNMESGHYYTLNEVGRFVWENIDGINALSNILQSILDTYKTGEEEAKEDLLQIVEELLKEKLIRKKE